MQNSGLNETVAHRSADPDRITVRELAYGDLPEVLSIEHRSFGGPWSPGMFVSEMSKESTLALAAERQGHIVAYLVISSYDEAWHLMNVAVAPEHRRDRLATLLIQKAFGQIGPDAPVTLEVRPSNRPAIALYEELGFRSYGHRKGYYPDNGEDALIMWRGNPAVAGVPEPDTTP
jgi:ribosomal-protein-alanine N-acetyltransferase